MCNFPSKISYIQQYHHAVLLTVVGVVLMVKMNIKTTQEEEHISLVVLSALT